MILEHLLWFYATDELQNDKSLDFIDLHFPPLLKISLFLFQKL